MTTTAPDAGTAAGILRLGNLFCQSKALLTAVDLDLFALLHRAPATEEQLRDTLGLHGRGLGDFLRLLVSLGLLHEQDGTYRNAEGAERYLVPGRDGCVAGFLRGADLNLYPVYARLAEALRTGKPQAEGDYTGMLENPTAVGHFVKMMDGLTHGLGPELLAALPDAPYRSFLDLGGCRGHLAAQLVNARPELTGKVFDLRQLEPFFHEYMAETGLTGRVSFHPGDFFQDPLPSADFVIFGHILHDWNPAQRQELLGRAYQAVNPGGTLLVYDRMLGQAADDTENLVASLNMLLVTEGGAEYTVTEISAEARAAGFDTITHRPLGDYDTLVVCRRR